MSEEGEGEGGVIHWLLISQTVFSAERGAYDP